MPRLLAPLLLLLCPLFVQAEDVIRVYNWNDYIAPEALKDFEKASGVRVEYHTYSTAEELKQALRSGEKIDVAVPSHNDLPQLIKDKLIQPLDFTRLPNRSHLDPQLMSKLAAVDPDNRHAVPYLWGAVGLAVNQPQAEKALGGPVPDSWSLLFDPQYSARLKSCGLSLLDAPDDARFDVQVAQRLPFLSSTGADWELVVAVRNLFRDGEAIGSVYDELLVIRPPKRVVGGVLVKF